jgi:hypothetical protein
MANQTKTVMVTTKHRGVFAGRVPIDQDMDAETLSLSEARMAVKFGTTRGVLELASTGPTKQSRISTAADIPSLRDVTAIFNVTDEAWTQWEAEPWG